MICTKCAGISGAIFLVIGILLLLRDLNVWNVWNIGAATFFFVIVGVVLLAKRSCPDCNTCHSKK